MSHRSGIAYIPALDGVRAAAVMAVVAFHCDVITGGWLGVDVFFVLSGFLITSLLAAELEATGTVALRAFWARRARRLLPGVAVLIGLVVALRAMAQVTVRARGVWGALTYSSNWLQLAASEGYWDAFARPDPLAHLWSLAVEEQFYLVWPVVVWAASRRWGARAVARVAGAALAGALFMQLFGLVRGWSIDRLYVGTDTRAFAFLAGAVVATPAVRAWLAKWSTVMMAVAAAVLVAAAIWMPGDTSRIFRGPLQALSLAAAALIAASANATRGPLLWAPVRAIGRWSYGIYLFHWPLAIASRLVEVTPWLRLVLVGGLSIGLAAASYRLVEMPIRQRRLRWPALIGAAIAAGAAAATALVLAQPVAPTLAELPTLGPPPAEVNVPAVGGRPAPVRVLVIGDSVPATAAPALATTAAARALQLEVDAQPGCVGSLFAADQLVPDVCVPFIDGLAARVRTVQPDVVVLWFGGTGRFFQHDGVRHDFCSADGDAAYAQRLEFLAGLGGGHRLVVVLPVPRADLDADAAAGAACEADMIRARQQQLGYTVVDLTPLVCPSFPSDCQRVARPDGLHFSAAGALVVAAEMFDQLGV